MTRKRATDGSVNKLGQVLGRKGNDTRDRALAAVERLLVESRGIEPTAAAVARAAGISAPAFYLYFSDVGDAVLAAVSQLPDRLTPVLDRLDPPWPREAVFDHARDFVEAYFHYWSENASLLRVRNRLADQGDERFVDLRVSSARQLAAGLMRKIGDPPFDDRGLACTPTSVANVLLTALERVATIAVLNLYPRSAGHRQDTMAAIANLIAMSVAPTGSPGATR